jgi:orotidine-5'-phosphate decarboxylase
MKELIPYKQSIVIACDVESKEKLKKLVKETYDVPKIGGYKVGSILALRCGLKEVVKTIRGVSDLPIIYDHQKSMTDIPALAEKFVRVVKECKVNAIIGFPLAGPETQEAWIKACKKVGLEVLVGGEMTHPRFKRSEGGYISDEALEEIYLLAARLGVNHFVVPGNKVERIKHYKALLRPIVGEPIFFAPGFVLQGGVISEAARAIGNRWHAIVGRAIYEAKDIRSAAKRMVRCL